MDKKITALPKQKASKKVADEDEKKIYKQSLKNEYLN